MKFLICTLLALTSLTAHAQIDELRTGRLSEVLQRVKTEHDISDRLAKPFDAIALSMHGSRGEVLAFFKSEAPHMTDESNTAWTKLLNEAAGHHAQNQGDIYKSLLVADAVGSFISARTSHAVKNLPFNEIDLEQILKSLTVEQTEKFASTLKRTADLAKNSNVLSLKDAFEQSMKEKGVYDEYEKGCKK